MTDDDGFITLPPGLFDPDSGTHKRPRTERTERPPKEDVVFVTALPGAPPAVPPITPEPEPAEVRPSIDTATPAVEPSAAEPSAAEAVPAPEPLPTEPIRRFWRLEVPGVSQPVVLGERALFLGRAPVPTPERADGTVLVIPDPGKSISKTHAMLELVDGTLWVHDLHSTNGVWVVPRGGEAIEVEPGIRLAVPEGAEVELGDVVIRVVRD